MCDLVKISDIEDDAIISGWRLYASPAFATMTEAEKAYLHCSLQHQVLSQRRPMLEVTIISESF